MDRSVRYQYRHSLIPFLVSILLIAIGCEKSQEVPSAKPSEVEIESRQLYPESTPPPEQPAIIREPIPVSHGVGTGFTKFSFDIYKLLSKEGNICASPFSTAMSLAALHPGTTGPLQQKLGDVLHLTLGDTNPYEPIGDLDKAFDVELKGENGFVLSLDASLWMQHGLKVKRNYLDLLSHQFKTEQYFADFHWDSDGSARRINNWASEKTRKKIQTVIRASDFTSQTLMVSVDTAYMFAQWEYPFQERATEEKPFWIDGSRKVDVQMMHTDTISKVYRYFENDQFQLLEMPYRTGDALDLSMIVILPRSYTGLKELEEGLTYDTFKQWVGENEKTQLEVFLPKFRFPSTLKYDEALQELGLDGLYKSGHPNFENISSNTPLWVDQIKQFSFINVNEKGTEVAVATISKRSGAAMGPVWKRIFKADHPFLFIVYERKSDTVLFIGRVTNPNPGGKAVEATVPPPGSKKFECPSEKELDALVMSHRDEIEACHKQYQSNELKMDGEIVIKMVLKNGKVYMHGISSSTFTQNALASCVGSHLRNLEYPFLDSYSTLIITYPIAFDKKGRLNKRTADYPVFYHHGSPEMRECYFKKFSDSQAATLSKRLTRQQVIDSMNKVKDEVYKCGRSNLTLSLKTVIMPSGRVHSAEAVGLFTSTEEGYCAAKLVKGLKFPSTESESTITYPFKLQPKGSE